MASSKPTGLVFAFCLALLAPFNASAVLPSGRKIEMDVREAAEARVNRTGGLVEVQEVRLLSRENVTEDRVSAILRVTMVRTKQAVSTTDRYGRTRPQDLRIINAIPSGTRWSETSKVLMRPVFGQWVIVSTETVSKDQAAFERALAVAKVVVATEDNRVAQSRAAQAAKFAAEREAIFGAQADAQAKRDSVLISEVSAIIRAFVDFTRNGEYARAMALTVDGSSAYYQGRGDFRAGIGQAPTMPTITGVARFFREGDVERLVLATQHHGELVLRRHSPEGWKLVGVVGQTGP